MTAQEFLAKFQETLAGEVTQAVINENVKYYSNYIREEMNKGKSEEEVMQMLGDPRLIARTIIDTHEAEKGTSYQHNYYQEGKFEEEQRKQKGFHMNQHEDGSYDIKFGGLKLNSWYGKLLLAVIVVAVVILVVMIITGLVSLALRIAVPVLVICLIVYLVKSILKK